MSVPSVWSKPSTPLGSPLPERSEADVVVIGAGIAGLATAMMLGEQGRRVALISRHQVDSTVTGRSNAKITALHQLVYADLERRVGTTGAANYASAATEAIGWLRHHAEDVLEPAVAMTVARDDEEHRQLLEEEAAARRAGLDVTLVDRPDQWPGALSGLRLDGQAQVDPVALSSKLLSTMPAGVTSHEGTVTGVRRVTGGVVVRGEEWQVGARHAVVATGLPILDRAGWFGVCEAQTSYLVALAHQPTVTDVALDMMISAGSPTRSVRAAVVDGQQVVLIGGEGHRTGKTAGAAKGVDELEAWGRSNIHGLGERVAAWSAEDFMSPDRLPYAGPLNRIGGPINIITGLSKWGFTLGVAAARAVAQRICEEDPSPFSQMLSTARLPDLAAVKQLASSQASVGVAAASGWGRAVTSTVPDFVDEGEGHVGRQGLQPCARSTVEGQPRTVSAICPHLGGIVAWNPVDKTWDCPLHGSRFEPDGAVRHGPTTTGLNPVGPHVDQGA